MSIRGDSGRSNSSTVGLLLGLLSAVAYMTANLGLRSAVDGGGAAGDMDWAVWVSANKAAPVAVFAWLVVGWRAVRGLPALPPGRLVLPLILTGLVMQFVGNVLFQFALSHCGLALTVPLTFSTIIAGGALIARLVLGEPLTPRGLMAMGAMMASIAVLSRGAETATLAMAAPADVTSTLLGVLAACASGLGYAAGGVMLRRCMTRNLSQSATIVLISTTGLVALGGLSLIRLGPEQLLATPPALWTRMLGAGVANCVAFFAITGAYKYLSVVKVSLLNGSQAAMAALAGVVLFGEPNTFWLQVGTALTIVGLSLAARREVPTTGGDKHDVTTSTLEPAPSIAE